MYVYVYVCIYVYFLYMYMYFFLKKVFFVSFELVIVFYISVLKSLYFLVLILFCVKCRLSENEVNNL